MVYQAYGGTNNPSQALTSDQNRKIFLGGLSYHTTDETLRSFCSRFGTITDCLVMRNPEGKSRGFGFVTYEDTTSVEEFMRSRPHTIDNRQIDPKRAMPREDQNSSDAHLTVKKLFVAGLREGINEENLRQYFSRYGNVTEVLIMKDRDGKPRGFAFVSFDDYDAVDKAILEKPHTLNGRNLDVKKAVPKEKMPEGGGSGSGGGGGGSSYNSGNSSNYGMSDTSGSGGGAGRNSYGSIRDNFGGGGGGGGSGGGSWDNQGGMPRMNNPNQSYNQQQASYQQQQGYNSGSGGYNSAAVASGGSGGYPQSYSSMAQNQQQPPQPMMSYEAYNSSTNMPFNASNQSSSTGYIQPSQPSYGQNQQQQPAFGGSGNGFGGNLPFNSSQQQPASTGGYNTGSSMPSAFDNSDSYGIISQNYGGSTGSGNYNNMQQQQPRGGGPMRGGRGGGGNYSGSGGYGNSGGNNSSSNYGNRPAPYSTRGGRGGGGGGSGGGGPSYYNNRGRGRGQ